MSVAASTWAWKLDLPATEKLIMLAFADHANDEDFTCWPSLTHLANKTGLDRSTVWKVVERVIVLGLITRAGSHGQNTKYRVHIGVRPKQLVADNNQLPETTSCPGHTEVVAHGNKVVAQDNPKSSLTITKPSNTLSATHCPGLDPKAWEQWVSYRKQIRKPLKPVSIPAAQETLAAFGSDQAAVVLQSIANSYQGLFPLKYGGTHATHQPIDNSAVGKVRRANAERERRDAERQADGATVGTHGGNVRPPLDV